MVKHCDDCKSPIMIHDTERDEYYCNSCGVVTTEHMQTGVRADESSPFVGNSTIIGNTNNSVKLRRLDQWVARSAVRPAISRSNMSRLRAIHDKLNVPESVYERASSIYKTSTCGKQKGLQLIIMMTACLYVACRESGAPRTLRDLSKITGVPVKGIARYSRWIMNTNHSSPSQYTFPVLITRAGNTTGSSPTCQRVAAEMVDKLPGSFTSGKNPMVMAAAVLCVAARTLGEEHSTTDLGDALMVSAASVRTRAKEIENHLGIPLNQSYEGADRPH